MSRVSVEVVRAYQDIRYGRPARRSWVISFVWVVVGLSLPYSMDFIPRTSFRILLFLDKAMPYLQNACYGLACVFALRALLNHVLARSWCVTRRLSRKFG
jgi:hypothetical protein